MLVQWNVHKLSDAYTRPLALTHFLKNPAQASTYAWASTQAHRTARSKISSLYRHLTMQRVLLSSLFGGAGVDVNKAISCNRPPPRL